MTKASMASPGEEQPDPIDGDSADAEASGASASSGTPHQILEFFEMCCALITTLAK
jgi:hypothetical protein